MTATSPVAAIKGSRIHHFPPKHASIADATTTYILGTATANTGHVLGFSGKLTRVQVSVPAGSTGTLTVNAYICAGTSTPAAGTLAMTLAITPSALYGSTETVSTATTGAALGATDALVVNLVTAS